jgi:hypothetical protein
MSVLASNASAALQLLAMGIADPRINDGLTQANRFCDVLSEGEKIRSGRRANHFSAEGLAKKDFLNLICEMPDSDRLTLRFDAVKAGIARIQQTLQQQGSSTVGVDVKHEAKKLADYFFEFSQRLAVYEAARSRLNAGRRARG